MEINIGDALHCEEQLKTTLHCDDKEKLREKLILLQREYLKTAQRLQRAERSEAVRIHVRSRTEQQSVQDQKDQEVTSKPPSVTLNTSSRSAAGELKSQELNESLSNSETCRRSQGIRLLLSSNAPDSINDSARGHRSSPALRLRSRRSRLRWERRSITEAERSTDHSEGRPEQREKTEADTAETGSGQEGVQTEEAEVVNESEELFSSRESESLLLTHWNTAGQTEAGSMGRKAAQTEKETERDQESTTLQLTCQDSALNSDRREQNDTQNRKIKEKEEGERDTDRGKTDGLFEDSSENNTEQKAAETSRSEKSPDNTPETKEGKRESARAEPDVKAVSLLDSCTLVEGLLFPVEYYVRTTRRMSSSQSQPDMQAIIHTQLGRGRPRRSRGRGRGRGQNKHTGCSEPSDKFNESDFSSPTAASPAEMNSQSPSADALCTPKVSVARSARGRRRRGRGRGRWRSQTPQCSHSLDSGQAPGELQLSGSPVSAPASLCGADGLKPCPAPTEKTVTVPDPPQPASPLSTSSQLPPEDEKVYPIFLKSSGKTSRPPEIRSPSNWSSLLLPPPPPAQTSLLPLPSLSSCPLLNSLSGFEVLNDFHLPDDQFGSLKLLKLRTATVETGVEDLTSPSVDIQRSDAPHSSATPLPLPHSLTPEVTATSLHTEEDAAQSKDLQNMNEPLNEESSSGGNQSVPPKSEPQSFTESASAVKDAAAHTAQSNTNREIDHFVKPHINFEDSPAVKVNGSQLEELELNESSLILLDDQNDSPCVNLHFEDKRSTARQTKTGNKAIVKALSFDSPPQKTQKKLLKSLTNHNECAQEQLDVGSPNNDSKESPARTKSPARVPIVHTQLLMSPLPASVPGHFILPSSLTPASPMLPSLGATPHPIPAALPLTSSPSAPVLTRPPPHSPSTQNLSPPALSPCPTSPTFFPPSQPLNSTRPQIQASCETVEPAACPPVPGVQGEVSGVRIEETAEEQTWRCLHMLKAPAGGCLVDACCVMGPSGGLCVAAAGKWAVCLWSQTEASGWSLKHTWAFNEPVINVFPVLDAASLLCVTLGQLEIREVRLLCCSGLSQALLCDGLVQAVVCVSGSRVVTSSHSSCGSTLQVFTPSDGSSACSSQPLVSPGVRVDALAPVDGLSDALIGTAEDGRLFIWNLKTGQLLRRVGLVHGLSHTACLRGFSYCGVLFVLLQHHFLSSLEKEDQEEAEDPAEEQKKKKSALFSLVAVNPRNGKSALATRLCPPTAWSGRLCEADVSGSSVVGLSQSGCVCVWELGRGGASKMIWCPESDGWQLARWGEGGGGTLLMGHHNGDVSLRCCSN